MQQLRQCLVILCREVMTDGRDGASSLSVRLSVAAVYRAALAGVVLLPVVRATARSGAAATSSPVLVRFMTVVVMLYEY